MPADAVDSVLELTVLPGSILEVDPLISLLAKISNCDDVKYYLRLHKLRQAKKRAKLRASMSGQPSSGAPSDSGVNYASSTTNAAPSVASVASAASPAPSIEKSLPPSASFDTVTATPGSVRSSSSAVRKSARDPDKRKSRLSGTFKDIRREWNFLSFDFKAVDWAVEKKVPPMGEMSVLEQENALMRDLLHVLIGIEGMYIRLQKGNSSQGHVLVIDEHADQLLSVLANKILKICPLYSSVISFIDQNDDGLVNQALAATMRNVIRDYFTLVAQLETVYRKDDLTLQKMFFLIQPLYANMEILNYFATTIHKVSAEWRLTNRILMKRDLTVRCVGEQKELRRRWRSPSQGFNRPRYAIH